MDGESSLTMMQALKNLEVLWSLSDEILEQQVSPINALTVPIPLRQPFVFYLGHLPAFVANKLLANVHSERDRDAYFDLIFSRGIDPDVDHPSRCHDHPQPPSKWPSWDAVLQYRDEVRATIRDHIHCCVASARLMRLVAEHESMHIETLRYMVVQMNRCHVSCCSNNDQLPFADDKDGPPKESESKVSVDWCEVPAGCTAPGCLKDIQEFAWDNEEDVKMQNVPAFRVAKYAVSVGDILKFVRAGGYRRRILWDVEDWAWVLAQNMRHPASWECDGSIQTGNFRVLTAGNATGKEAALLPASISLAEARAFARWLGGDVRIPTELEWVRAAYKQVDSSSPKYQKNISENIITSFPHNVRVGEKAWCGAVGMVGNGWELTSTPLARFPGFQETPEYPEYSTDFFDGKHFILKGASWATHPILIRKSFRNFYQARYPYVFSKLRLVTSSEMTNSLYGT